MIPKSIRFKFEEMFSAAEFFCIVKKKHLVIAVDIYSLLYRFVSQP